MVDGLSALAVILIASFAIDSVVRACIFVLGFLPGKALRLAEPDSIQDPEIRALATRRHKLVYFTLAAAFGFGVLVYFGDVRIFRAMNVEVHALIDVLVTGLVLVGGADRISTILDVPGLGGGSEPPRAPIEITGTLLLDERTARALPTVSSLEPRA